MCSSDRSASSQPGSGEGRELLAERVAELLAANRFLDSVFEHLPTPVYLKDAAQLLYVRVNPAAEALFGISREKMIGKSAHEVFEKDEADIFVAQDRGVLASGAAEDISEHRLVSRTRNARLLHVREVPVFGESGEPTHILGIVEDVTHQKELEKKILSLNSAPQARAEDLESFTAEATHDLRSSLSVIGGYAGLLEKNHVRCLDETGRRYVSLIRARINGMAKLVDDLLAFSRPGRHEVSKASVDMHGLVVQRTAALAAEIEQRKQAEEKISWINTELEQRVLDRTAQLAATNRELESFSYSVSHDLRVPLRHINGYIQLLGADSASTFSPEARRHLNVIADASRRMGDLIDDLLEFSRMGRTEMRESSVDLDALVREAIGQLEMATQGRNIAWQLTPLPAVTGDAAMLRLVLANLLGNAVKYTHPRETAQIEVGSAGEEGGRLVVFVRDNGVGFDMQHADKLFGVFQRLHRPDEFEGTGIGLASVRRIIERHGGRVWAEGQPGAGATFYFSLSPEHPPTRTRP